MFNNDIFWFSKYDNKKELEIFEGLNSKGSNLDKFDLIKNYIFSLCSSKLHSSEMTIRKIVNLYHNHLGKKLCSKKDKENKKYEDFFNNLIQYWTGKEVKNNESISDYLIKVKNVINEMLELKNKEFENVKEFEDFLIKLEEYIDLYKIISRKDSINFKNINILDIFNCMKIKSKNTLFVPLLFLLKDFINKYNMRFSPKEVRLILWDLLRTIIWVFIVTRQGNSDFRRFVFKYIKEAREDYKDIKSIDSKWFREKNF